LEIEKYSKAPHFPVMVDETIELLQLRPGLTYIDATAGAGGHLREILQGTGGDSRVIAFDQDKEALDNLEKALKEEGFSPEDLARLTLIHANFRDLKGELEKRGIHTVDGGILADLGVSSMQIDQGERGFSFQKEGPLDMRMNQSAPLSAYQIVNEWKEQDLADIIYKYGEERNSRKIARRIVESRPIESTLQLADIVARCNSGAYRISDKQNKKNSRNNLSGGFAGGGKPHQIHPATRTFQALRMAVNQELESLEQFLNDASSLLAPEATLVVITFHSLEDRIVKQFFQNGSKTCICPPKMPVCVCHKKADLLIKTRKPVTASEKELLANTRSRSAKLRAAQKLN